MQKAERLNQELIYLSDKKFFNLQDLITTFNISKRTALRDIASLEKLGLALYSEVGPAGGYRLIQNDLLANVYFNSDEIHAIFFALKAMETMSETPFNESFQRINSKLLKRLAPHRQAQVLFQQDIVNFYNVPAIGHNHFLRDLLAIIINNHLARVTFKGQMITIQPYQLFYRDGYWLVTGWRFDTATCWNYRCDYLTTCHELADSALILPRKILQKKITRFKQGQAGVPFKAVLTKHGKEHYLRGNYPGMHLNETNDEIYLTGHYDERTFDYVIDYLLTFGEHVKILGPHALVQGYLKKLTALMNQYRD